MRAVQRSNSDKLPSIRVEVVEPGVRTRKGWYRCEIGENLTFNTEKLESYFFAQWEPVLFDTLLLAAAVEFCDRTQRRPANGWGRAIALRVPVHELGRWRRDGVAAYLHETLRFLTGDQWEITFYERKKPEMTPRQGLISLPAGVAAVIPFSDGMDSCAVAGIMARNLGERLVRVRLGTKKFEGGASARRRQPFTSVPYRLRAGERQFVESSSRSRGFKFALISALAAYLAKAKQIIVPESGQGALGPALVPVGRAYVDYRSNPLFTGRMEKFLEALLNYQIKYDFPQLWCTKGETLRQFVAECSDTTNTWQSTWSCWQQNRQVSVERKKRQCGICAACMLRRLSVHAAGLSEPSSLYVWENLKASTFDAGAAASFEKRKITRAMREYAIAGALHLDHLAVIRHSPGNKAAIKLNAFQLSQVCGLDESDVRSRLERFLEQHEMEWRSFMNFLGPKSFVSNWVRLAQ